MKIRKMVALSAGIIFAAMFAQSQRAFVNLNFESADLSPVPPNGAPTYVPEASALPGWSAAVDSEQLTQVLQNTITFGEASVDILGPNYPAAALSALGVIDGNYTAVLQSGGDPQNSSVLVNASIDQTGLIPLGSESLTFKAWQFNTAFSVSFAGNVLPLVALGAGPNYTLYGADVSFLAGETGPLEFTALTLNTGLSEVGLDDITFSTTAVPEPSPLVLTGIGGLLFALFRRSIKSR